MANAFFPLKTVKILLIGNALFWLFMSLFTVFSGNAYASVIGPLLFLETILYLISYIGISKRIKIIYLFSLLLTLSNSVLSITDQVGILDMISLIFSVAAFGALLLLWKQFMRSNKKNKH